MKFRTLSLLATAIFVISLAANAQHGSNMQRWENLSPEKKAMVMKKRQAEQKSDLRHFFSEEQRETVKKIHLETAKKVKPLKNELRELTAHQTTLITADDADLKAINSNIDKISKVKADIAKIMAKQHQEVRSLLNEEQLLKFDAMKANNRKRIPDDLRKQNMRKGEWPAFDERI